MDRGIYCLSPSRDHGPLPEEPSCNPADPDAWALELHDRGGFLEDGSVTKRNVCLPQEWATQAIEGYDVDVVFYGPVRGTADAQWIPWWSQRTPASARVVSRKPGRRRL